MHKRRLNVGDRVFTFINMSVLAIAAVIVVYPVVYVLSASFSSADAVTSGKVMIFPVDVTLNGYRAVFADSRIGLGFANSVFYTVFGTVINIVVTLMAAYPLSRPDFKGRGIFTAIFVFTMYFNGGLIPTYMLIRSLGMLDSRLALLIPQAMGVWFVIITRTYLRSNIPLEMLEAAKMDGCRPGRFMVSIVVPLAAPIIAVLVLWYAVGHWNRYFDALIYLKTAEKFPLQIVLRSILFLNLTRLQDMDKIIVDVDRQDRLRELAELLKYSLIVVAMVPVILVYPFVQRYFVKGIMIGALKS